MKVEPGKIKRAEAVNQLAVDSILTSGFRCYAWIKRLLCRIVSEQNSVNWFNAARIFGDICFKL